MLVHQSIAIWLIGVGIDAIHQNHGRISRHVQGRSAEPKLLVDRSPSQLLRTQDSSRLPAEPMHLADRSREPNAFVLAVRMQQSRQKEKEQRILNLTRSAMIAHTSRSEYRSRQKHTLHSDGVRTVLGATMNHTTKADALAHEKKHIRLLRIDTKAQMRHQLHSHDSAVHLSSGGDSTRIGEVPVSEHQLSSTIAPTAVITSSGSVDISGGDNLSGGGGQPSIAYGVEYPLAANQVPAQPIVTPAGAPVQTAPVAPAVVPAPAAVTAPAPAPATQQQNSTTQQANGGSGFFGTLIILMLVVTALVAGAVALIRWHRERKLRRDFTGRINSEEGSFKPRKSSIRYTRSSSRSSVEEDKTGHSGKHTSTDEDVARAGKAGSRSSKFWNDQKPNSEFEVLAKTYSYKKSKSIGSMPGSTPDAKPDDAMRTTTSLQASVTGTTRRDSQSPSSNVQGSVGTDPSSSGISNYRGRRNRNNKSPPPSTERQEAPPESLNDPVDFEC